MDKTDIKDREYLVKLENTSFSPIFIIGLQRSGTSILYKILAETKEFNVVTIYHLLRYNELLYIHTNKLETQAKKNIQQFFDINAIITRGVDKIQVTPEYVHDYSFLFAKYHYPRMITKKNVSLFEALCKKIMFISNNNKPLLLKNTHECLNFLNLKKMYPNAKFIFIHRNPLYQISSALKVWQEVFKNKNKFVSILSEWYDINYNNPLSLMFFRIHYSLSLPPGLFELINHTKKATNYYLRNINHLKKNDFIAIKYENLCYEPNKVFNNLQKFLNISTNLDVQLYINPRKLELSREVKFTERYIIKKMNTYFNHFGYNSR